MLNKLTKVLSVIVILTMMVPFAAVALAAPAQQGVACEEDYSVQADDWLSKLADKFYGDVLAYPAILTPPTRWPKPIPVMPPLPTPT